MTPTQTRFVALVDDYFDGRRARLDSAVFADLDSFDRIDLVELTELHFGVEITDDEAAEFAADEKTVRQWCALIDEKLP